MTTPNWLSWFSRLLGRAPSRDETHALAGDIHRAIQELSGTRAANAETSTVATLRSSLNLLRRLLEEPPAEPDHDAVNRDHTPVAAPETPTDAALPAAALALIDIRDQVLAGERSPDAGVHQQLLHWLYGRLGEVLNEEGVETLEKTGPFDTECQEPVEARPAPDENSDEHVADTVRPGYRYRGTLHRRQQVVLFVS